MVNLLMKDTIVEWSKKTHWNIKDIFNIYCRGLENIDPSEIESVEEVREAINQAIASGHLKASSNTDGPYFNRDDIIRWASQNLPNFPFSLEDFEPVVKAKRPGTDREDTQLRMIGVLAMLLAQKHGGYKIAERPNQKAIAEACSKLLDHLTPANFFQIPHQITTSF